MTRLEDLQTGFQRYLTGGDAGIQALVADGNDISVDARLDVYGQAYRLRLLEALGKDFPGLRSLIGAQEFEAAGLAYIDRHPSRHPSLRWFGRHFAGFLRSDARYRDRPLWAEVADFEWTTGECFDAADAPIAAVESMQDVPPDAWAGMRLQLQPSVRRLQLRWNAPAIWKAAKDGETVPPIEAAADAVPWLLWRRDMKIYWRSLGAEEAAALTATAAGATFGELCELLCEHVGQDAAPLRAATLLRQWLLDAMIVRIELQD